jgi:hypothetical protein
MKKPKYTVKFAKEEHCWSVYDPEDDWIADCLNEREAKRIADALNYCELEEPEAKE